MKEEENNLYARWLNNELSAAEKAQLEANGDARLLQSIVAAVNEWSLPELKGDSYNKIREKISAQKEVKVVPLYKKTWTLALAASALLAVILIWVLVPRSGEIKVIELASAAGQSKTFTLPDNTSITLFGRSKVTYNENTFKNKREVNLEGEGYFEVNQKGDFAVTYSLGVVRVLGTKFDVLSGNDIAAVKCFEGKVEVEMQGEKAVLQQGSGVRKIGSEKMNSFEFEESAVLRNTSETRFENTPLKEVCASMSLFYDIQIEGRNVDLRRNFSGRFTQSNLDSALTMVFEPMGISFTKDGRTVILSNK